MRSIGLFGARKRPGALVVQAHVGGATVITRRGKPVARLIPMDPGFDRIRVRSAVEGLLEASRGLSLDGLSIKELIHEGRA
jgi:prevent-host-death family protein